MSVEFIYVLTTIRPEGHLPYFAVAGIGWQLRLVPLRVLDEAHFPCSWQCSCCGTAAGFFFCARLLRRFLVRRRRVGWRWLPPTGLPQARIKEYAARNAPRGTALRRACMADVRVQRRLRNVRLLGLFATVVLYEAVFGCAASALGLAGHMCAHTCTPNGRVPSTVQGV